MQGAGGRRGDVLQTYVDEAGRDPQQRSVANGDGPKKLAAMKAADAHRHGADDEILGRTYGRGLANLLSADLMVAKGYQRAVLTSRLNSVIICSYFRR